MKIRNFYKFTFLMLIPFLTRAQVAPTATIVGTSSLFCMGLPVTFSSAASHPAVSYTWTVIPSKGLSQISDIKSETVNMTFTASTTYTVALTVKDSTGLTSTTQTLVPVAKKAKASFNATLLDAGYPNELVLTNYSSDYVSTEWLYSEGGKDVTTHASKSYAAPGNYTVTLVAQGLRGCNDSSSYAFNIAHASEVILPNIFSPNGDGVNDFYKPITKGIYKLNAYVYNRNQTLIHSWDKVNGFWDGHTTSGLGCATGEYLVIVEAYGFDGQKFKLKTLVTLVR